MHAQDLLTIMVILKKNLNGDSLLPLVLLILIVVCTAPCVSSVSSNNRNGEKGSLRGFEESHTRLLDMPKELSPNPKLTECLLSAVSSNDCGTALAGCIWCKEPIAGLCVTETAAEKMNIMPFFTCSVGLTQEDALID